MNSIRNISSLAFILLLFSSCEDLLVKEIPIEDIDFKSRMVVNSVLFNGADSLQLTLAENISVLKEAPIVTESISGATIKCFEDDLLIGTFIKKETNPFYYLPLVDDFDGSQKTYRLEIEHPDYPSATAQTTMPQNSQIIEVEFVEDLAPFPSNFGDSTILDGLHVTFLDPKGEDNYYVFDITTEITYADTFIYGNDTIIENYEFYIEPVTIDPLIEQGNGKYYLSDATFDGEEYTLTLLLDSWDFNGFQIKDHLGEFKLIWISASEEHFKFNRSVGKYWQNSGFGLFSEPITIYSNVENGVGIFSSVNYQEVIF